MTDPLQTGIISGIDGKFYGIEGKISGIEGKFPLLKGKPISGIEGESSGIEGKISGIEGKFPVLKGKIQVYKREDFAENGKAPEFFYLLWKVHRYGIYCTVPYVPIF